MRALVRGWHGCPAVGRSRAGWRAPLRRLPCGATGPTSVHRGPGLSPCPTCSGPASSRGPQLSGAGPHGSAEPAPPCLVRGS
eukprot:12327326-Alexandrium_andersonii.AAC.1